MFVSLVELLRLGSRFLYVIELLIIYAGDKMCWLLAGR